MYLAYFIVIFIGILSTNEIWGIWIPSFISALFYLGFYMQNHSFSSLLDSFILLRIPFFFLTAFISSISAIQIRNEKAAIERKILENEKFIFLGQAISGIVHQIKNPLNSLFSISKLLTIENNPEKIREKAEKISQKAQECMMIVDNLLDFLKRKKISTKKFNINNIIDKILSFKQEQLVLDNIKVHKKYSLTLPEINTSPELVEHVLVNIINNAIDAMLSVDNERELIIETENKDNKVIIKISDTGPGIPEEILLKLFTPLYSTKTAGTGLGLYISKTIIEQLGGKIYAGNNWQKGSIFTVELPLQSILP